MKCCSPEMLDSQATQRVSSSTLLLAVQIACSKHSEQTANSMLTQTKMQTSSKDEVAFGKSRWMTQCYKLISHDAMHVG